MDTISNKSWDWSFIEKIMYINLDYRKDRKNRLTSSFEIVGIPEDKYQRFTAIRHENGKYGCLLSHLEILKMAKEKQWKNVLVVEDDMVFNNHPYDFCRLQDFFTHLQQQPGWDVAMLSGNYYIVHTVIPGFVRLEWAYGGNCYIVNAHYYDTLIANFLESKEGIEKNFNTDKFHLDDHWRELMVKDNWFGIYPCLGYQSNGFSDINNCHIDQKDTFSRNFDILKMYGST